MLLLFPLSVRMNFDLSVNGVLARFSFFRKNFYTYEKKFGKKKDDEEFADGIEDESKTSDDDLNEDEHEAVVPSYVPPPKTEKAKTPEPAIESMRAEPAGEHEPATESAEKPATETQPASEDSSDEKVGDSPEAAAEHDENGKPEKRKNLTDFEFWTILLTPDLDERAFRYVTSLLGKFIKVFKIRFHDCYVEGIRSDYVSMGYGAAANGIMKGFPWLCDWDLRMDWCNDRELHSEGTVSATVNLCRILSFLLVLLAYGSVLGISFWRRRAKVLKTSELPELGYVRRKIRGWMVEE